MGLFFSPHACSITQNPPPLFPQPCQNFVGRQILAFPPWVHPSIVGKSFFLSALLPDFSFFSHHPPGRTPRPFFPTGNGHFFYLFPNPTTPPTHNRDQPITLPQRQLPFANRVVIFFPFFVLLRLISTAPPLLSFSFEQTPFHGFNPSFSFTLVPFLSTFLLLLFVKSQELF